MKKSKGESIVSVGKCSNKPNCVSSIEERKEFRVEPFNFEDPVKGLNELVEKIKKMDSLNLLKRVKMLTLFLQLN